jgi:hypothetical protein
VGGEEFEKLVFILLQHAAAATWAEREEQSRCKFPLHPSRKASIRRETKEELFRDMSREQK